MRELPRVPEWIRRRATQDHSAATDVIVGSGVSATLFQTFGYAIAPGHKGKCPFCGHSHTFSIKRDDTLGKCFHPSCGEYLVRRREQRDEIDDLDDALRPLYRDWHRHLLTLAAQPPPNAYHYVVIDRGIHPRVVIDAMMGAVPPAYDATPHFEAAIRAFESSRDDMKRKRGAKPTIEQRTGALRTALEKLKKCSQEGWLTFFYTDADSRIVSIRFRQPYSKQMLLFKPTETGGVFTYATFRSQR